MALNTTPAYSLKEISIIPAIISDIKSRSECNPLYENNMLPIFASPMSTVVNLENLDIWKQNNIMPIIPRNISYEDRIKHCKNNWIAVSLHEFDDFIENIMEGNSKYYILIDVANGHMNQIYNLCEKGKDMANAIGTKLFIMVGNIANHETVQYIAKLNAVYSETHIDTNSKNLKIIDSIRVGIGGGQCCITASSTKIYNPMGSLLNNINEIKKQYKTVVSDIILVPADYPKIIADGGIRTYADVITALALGADYVMIGSTFGSLFESAAPFVKDKSGFQTDMTFKDEDEKIKYITTHDLSKHIWGMSTYTAQKEIDKNSNKRLTEGIGRIVKCNMTVKQWSDAMKGYMKSCMSYCNKTEITDFIGNVQCQVMSPHAAGSFNNSIDSYVGETLHTIKD